MGYILPFIPIQSMQYANRMVRSEQGIPVITRVPHIQNETRNKYIPLNNNDSEHKKISFQQVLSSLEGKGLMINETI
jgi:hypothetical protein